jgi:hypothetical protein
VGDLRHADRDAREAEERGPTDEPLYRTGKALHRSVPPQLQAVELQLVELQLVELHDVELHDVELQYMPLQDVELHEVLDQPELLAINDDHEVEDHDVEDHDVDDHEVESHGAPRTSCSPETRSS